MSVAAPTLTTTLPAALTLTVGEPFSLAVAAAAPHGEPLRFQWTQDGTDIDVDAAEVATAQVAGTDAGLWAVSVTYTTPDGEVSDPATSQCQVSVTAPAAPPAQPAPPATPTTPAGPQQSPPAEVLVWDPAFARNALIAGAVGLLVLVGLVVVAAVVGASEARLTVIGLLGLASLLTVSGVVMALLDLRSRARLVEESAKASRRGFPTDVVKELPGIIEKFGALRLASAVLLLAAVAMVCVTTIAVQSLPQQDPTDDPTSSESSTS